MWSFGILQATYHVMWHFEVTHIGLKRPTCFYSILLRWHRHRDTSNDCSLCSCHDHSVVSGAVEGVATGRDSFPQNLILIIKHVRWTALMGPGKFFWCVLIRMLFQEARSHRDEMSAKLVTIHSLHLTVDRLNVVVQDCLHSSPRKF